MQQRLKWFWTSEAGLRALEKLSRRPFLLACYCYLSRGSWPEQRAVLAGQVAYHRTLLGSGPPPVYALRRNLHRVEKALATPNRRSVFALDVARESVQFLRQMLEKNSGGGDASTAIAGEVQWALAVLSDYFSTVDLTDPLVASLERDFRAIATGCSPTEGNGVGTRRSEPSKFPAPFECLRALARRRRSIRAFATTAVAHDVIDQALDVARFAPSACNRQAFSFRVVDDPTLARSLLAIPGGASTGFGEHVPCVVAVVGQLRAYFHVRDCHVIYIDGGLAAMNFLLALESQGVASCCINWPNIDANHRRAQALLHLEDDERIVMLIAVGYADPTYRTPRSLRRSVAAIRRFNLDED
jgi:nitroreductase